MENLFDAMSEDWRRANALAVKGPHKSAENCGQAG